MLPTISGAKSKGSYRVSSDITQKWYHLLLQLSHVFGEWVWAPQEARNHSSTNKVQVNRLVSAKTK
jgi:hypothetical protein